MQDQNEHAARELSRRKAIGRGYIRSLPLGRKIEELGKLQEKYYSMLELRERNGGRPIPERWKKWRAARTGTNFGSS